MCDRVRMRRAGKLVVDARLDDLQRAQGLLVAVDRDAQALLAAVPGVNAVETRTENDGLHHYHLDAPAEAAPAVAAAVTGAGLGLHRLQSRRQDLETLFAQVNAQVDAQDQTQNRAEVAHG